MSTLWFTEIRFWYVDLRLIRTCAPSENSDLPVHSRSLIRITLGTPKIKIYSDTAESASACQGSQAFSAQLNRLDDVLFLSLHERAESYFARD